MAASPTRTVKVDAELLERAQRLADERGVAVPQLVAEALEHELAERADDASNAPSQAKEGQPPLTCIGAFSSGRGDLSKLAISEDVFEPEPFR